MTISTQRAVVLGSPARIQDYQRVLAHLQTAGAQVTGEMVDRILDNGELELEYTPANPSDVVPRATAHSPPRRAPPAVPSRARVPAPVDHSERPPAAAGIPRGVLGGPGDARAAGLYSRQRSCFRCPDLYFSSCCRLRLHHLLHCPHCPHCPRPPPRPQAPLRQGSEERHLGARFAAHG